MTPASAVTLKQLVNDRKDALAAIDANTEQSISQLREAAEKEKAKIAAELAEVGIIIPGISINGAASKRGRKASGHDNGNPPQTLREQVLNSLRVVPQTRQNLLMAFKGWRAGSIDNTLAVLLRQGKVARIGVGSYAFVNSHARSH